MTDQIPADKVREARDLHRDAAKMVTITDAEREIHQHVADAMEALLPAPPTLADMTEEERRDCRWMQCDYGEPGRPRDRGVIGYFDQFGNEAVILTTTCGIVRRDYARVTPRPDLPRLAWPGTEKPAPAPALPDGWRLADHKEHGRVIVTSASTSPNSDGYVYILLPTADARGHDWVFCPTKRLTFLDTDQEADQ